MNRVEFLEKLSQMLSNLPEEERAEALSYYEEYLEEAGPEREAQILEELGSPEQVAATIRENLYGNSEKGGVYTETGYYDSTGADRLVLDRFTQIVPGKQPAEQEENGTGEKTQAGTGGREDGQPENSQYGANWDDGYAGAQEQGKEMGHSHKKMSKEMKALLIVLLIIFAVPIGSVLIGLLGGLIGIVAGIFGGSVGLIGSAIGFLVSGVTVVITGIMNLTSATASGFLLCGIGCLLFVAGMLCVMASGFVFGTALPWLIRKIRQFFRWLSGKRKGRME